MNTPATARESLRMKATAAVSLLVKPAGPATASPGPAGSAMGEALHRGLLAAGMRVAVVPTVFDAVVEAERIAGPRVRTTSGTSGGLRHLIVGIDYFGQQEFRLFPLVRREWPETLLVAYHSPGLDYKGRLAELLGADAVLATLEDVARFAEGLASSGTAEVPASAKATAGGPPAPLAPEPAPSVSASSVPGMRVPLAACPPVPPEQHTGGQAASGTPVRTDTCAPDIQPPAAAAPANKPGVAAPAKSAAEALAALAAVIAESSPTGPYVTSVAGQPPGAPGDNFLEGGEVVGTIELTEEELRLLLGEEDEA
jgi:hypothetical protein